MKSILIIASFCIGICLSFAQTVQERDRFTFSTFTSISYKSHGEYEESPVRSIGFNFNFYKEIPFKEGRVSFAYGLGFSTVKSHNNIDFHPASVNRTSVSLFTNYEALNKRNRAVQRFIDVPLEFRFRGLKRSGFQTAIGFKGSYLVNDYWKVHMDNQKIKYYNSELLNNWRYGPTLRVGYGLIHLEGFLNLNSLTKTNHLNVQYFSVGITYSSGRRI